MLPRHKDSLPKKTQLFEHKGMHKIRSLATKDARVSVVCEGEKSYCNIKGYNMFTAIDEIKLVSAAFLLCCTLVWPHVSFVFWCIFLKNVIILAIFRL